MEAHARHSDPSTSHQAARAITPHLSPIQREVLRFANGRGTDGFTDLELQTIMDDHRSTYRTRRLELFDMDLIENTGRTVRHEGDRRERIVWAITRRGVAKANRL